METTAIIWANCLRCGRPYIVKSALDENLLCDTCESEILKSKKDVIKERSTLDGKQIVQVDDKTCIVISPNRNAGLAIRDFKRKLNNYRQYIIEEQLKEEEDEESV